MVVGIFAEKPSAARNIAKALGDGNSMQGTYQGTEYVIVNARGHLFQYSIDLTKQVSPSVADKYSGPWSLTNLPWDYDDFSWVLSQAQDSSDLLKTIRSTLANVDEIVCFTDVDPSGEGGMIFGNVIKQLKLDHKKLTRAYFTDEAPASLRKGFEQRKPIASLEKFDEYRKARFRSQWDFFSMQFTRIATKVIDQYGTVPYQGRLKSAIILLVGDQLAKIAAYKKVPSYTERFTDENGVHYADPEAQRYAKKDDVPRTLKPSDVIKDSATRKKTAPPPMLDLASLSAILARRGVKAKDVLSTYQAMYEFKTPLRAGGNTEGLGVVSYPRTEDKNITPEQYAELKKYIDDIAAVVGVDPKILTRRDNPRTKHVKVGGAHGANRPGTNIPQSLDQVEGKFGKIGRLIYETLARNFLSIVAEDYEYEAQVGHVKDYPTYIGKASVPKSMGYKAVFGDVDEPDEDDNAKGLGREAKPIVHESFPPRPQTPNMDWLMKQLARYDVGTGATRTATYAEMNTTTKFRKAMMKEHRNALTLTDIGEISYRLLPGTKIGDLTITAQVQKAMSGVAQGSTTAKTEMDKIEDLVRHDIEVMKKNAVSIRKDMGMSTQTYADKEYFTGPFKGQHVKFNRVWRGHRFTDEECQKLLAGEEINLFGIEKKDKSGTYDVKGVLSEQSFTGNGGATITFFGFEQTGFISDGKVPAKWSTYVFSDDERSTLEREGKLEVTGVKSNKTGNTYNTTLYWIDEDGTGTKRIVPEFALKNR